MLATIACEPLQKSTGGGVFAQKENCMTSEEFKTYRKAYECPSMGVLIIPCDVVTVSDDPAVDDGYGESGGFDWGV